MTSILLIIRMAHFCKVTNLLIVFPLPHCPMLVHCTLYDYGLEYNTVILMFCVV